jgi:hypothetical protein
LKLYFYNISHFHQRDNHEVGITVGVLYAKDEEDAKQKVWDKHGNDYTAGVEVYEVGADGEYQYIVR